MILGATSLRLGHPLQGRQPEIVSAVHERLIALAQARRILSDTGLIHDDVAHGAPRLQIPGMIEARLRSRHVAVPSQALIRYILVHFAFDRQAERGPPEYSAVPEHRISALNFDILGIGVPSRPPCRFDDMCPVAGNMRIFATIDFGQSVVSRMIASFIQAHPAVTTELAYSNRPLHMIEEGCDAGVLVGNLTDETVIARSLGHIRRYPVAAPVFLSERKSPKTPGDLQRWPWLSLSSAQFGGGTSVEMYSAQGEQRLEIKPIMISEGVTSLREAIRMGLGVAVLPECLIEDDLVSGRLVRVLPKWQARELPVHVVYPAQRRLPLRVRTFIDFAVNYMSTVLKPNKR